MTTKSPTPKQFRIFTTSQSRCTTSDEADAVIYRFALIMLQPSAGFYIPTKILHWLGDEMNLFRQSTELG
jgi:hypothetical protein